MAHQIIAAALFGAAAGFGIICYSSYSRKYWEVAYQSGALAGICIMAGAAVILTK